MYTELVCETTKSGSVGQDCLTGKNLSNILEYARHMHVYMAELKSIWNSRSPMPNGKQA